MLNPLPLITRLLFKIGEADLIDKENIIGDDAGLYVKPLIIEVRLLDITYEFLALQLIKPFGIVNTIA